MDKNALVYHGVPVAPLEGLALNRVVAEVVFGWRDVRYQTEHITVADDRDPEFMTRSHLIFTSPEGLWGYTPPKEPVLQPYWACVPFDWSGSDRDALQVFRRLVDEGWCCQLRTPFGGDRNYWADFSRTPTEVDFVSAQTFAVAICQAALYALLVKES